MLLSDWRVLVRRWYVVAVGLPLTFALCFLIMKAVPVKYEADSKILLLPPEQKVSGLPTNPYLNLGGLDGMTDVLSSAMGDATVSQQLEAAGHKDVEYTFLRDQTAAGPVVLLSVTAKSAADAMASQAWLLDKARPVLAQLQQQVNVPTSTYITETVFTQDDKPKVDRKSQLRLLLVALVAGVGLSYLTAALVDGLVRSRRKPPAGASQALSSPTSLRRPEVSQVPQLAGIPTPPPRSPGGAPAPVGSVSSLKPAAPVQPVPSPAPAAPDGSPTTAPSGVPVAGPTKSSRFQVPQLKSTNGKSSNGKGKSGQDRDQGQGGLNWLP